MKHSLLLFLLSLLLGCAPSSTENEVVLYASIDETYARRAAKVFEAETGIRVRLVSDSEIAKSSGLLTRLLAEAENPVADVFWSGDIARAFTLDRARLLDDVALQDPDSLPKNAFLADQRVIGTSARARVIITHQPKAAQLPKLPQSVEELASPTFAPHSCLANPLFGTTTVHAAALFRAWGNDRASAFFENFTKNGGTMLASNGEVKRRVGSGEFVLGLTDSDDLHVALLDGKPVSGIVPRSAEAGGLLLPSAAVLIKQAPHPEPARRLASFLSGPKAEALMASCEAGHFPMRPALAKPERFASYQLPEPLDAAAWQEIDALLETLLPGYLTTWVDNQRRREG